MKRCDKIGRTLMMLHGGKETIKLWQKAEEASSMSQSAGKKLWTLPTLSNWQVRSTLMDLGVECITFEDEADTEIVKECKRRGAYAVMGADSDFFAIQV
jgi:hypothetical protein